MQKLVRRTILAQKQVARRSRKAGNKRQRQERTSILEQARFHHQDEVKQIRKARQAMKEDWELGPLAPKRDVGFEKEAYGTVDSLRTQGPTLTERDKEVQKEFIKGIYKGETVVVVKGREKGKIGKLMEKDDERGEAKIEGVNMIDVKIPEWMLVNEQEEDKRLVRSMEQPVPYSNIRLVVTIKDQETGVEENFTCEKVHTQGQRRWVFGPDGSQVFLPGSRIRASEHGAGATNAEKRAAKAEDTPADTLRMEVEEKSFVPTLLRPPMPGSVIDELRNKFSIFRTRHDPEYIVAKIKEDEEAEAQRNLTKKMRTPLNEINRLERKLKKAKGKGKLTDQILERIGQVIASKRQLQLETAGVEQEPEVVAT